MLKITFYEFGLRGCTCLRMNMCSINSTANVFSKFWQIYSPSSLNAKLFCANVMVHYIKTHELKNTISHRRSSRFNKRVGFLPTWENVNTTYLRDLGELCKVWQKQPQWSHQGVLTSRQDTQHWGLWSLWKRHNPCDVCTFWEKQGLAANEDNNSECNLKNVRFKIIISPYFLEVLEKFRNCCVLSVTTVTAWQFIFVLFCSAVTE